jgi:hypothetical protein
LEITRGSRAVIYKDYNRQQRKGLHIFQHLNCIKCLIRVDLFVVFMVKL